VKRFLMTGAVTALMIFLPGGLALAADVGVSISVGDPNFYGRIDIGGYPQPQLLYPEPVIIEREVVHGPPIYLRVPPGHAKHWSKHCRQYHACGRRVYFVRNNWYANEYAPRYRERHRGDHHQGHWENRGGHRGNNGHSHGHDHR